MATYKAEFLSHYYERKLRPIAAYSMGWIYWWARLAEIAPGLANAIMSLPIFKTLGGVAPRAADAAVREDDVRRAVQRRKSRVRVGLEIDRSDEVPKRVLLWPDTFNNHFHPAHRECGGRGAGSGGLRSDHPAQTPLLRTPSLRLGLPRHGQKSAARNDGSAAAGARRRHPDRRSRAELRLRLPRRAAESFPGHDDAMRLSKAVKTLPEFLLQENVDAAEAERQSARSGALPSQGDSPLRRRRAGAEEDRTRRRSSRLRLLRHGRRVRIRARQIRAVDARRRARAAARGARGARDTIIVADGFSCREQIAQGTDREALHLAQVLQLAMHKRSGRRVAGAALTENRPRSIPGRRQGSRAESRYSRAGSRCFDGGGATKIEIPIELTVCFDRGSFDWRDLQENE